jgi:hypothetical protein
MATKEYSKKYYLANREKFLAARRKYVAENRERVLAEKAIDYKKHKFLMAFGLFLPEISGI